MLDSLFSNRPPRLRWTLLLAWFLLALAGCSSGGGQTDAGDGSDGNHDGGDGKARYTKPYGYASVTFFIDDTANRTYKSGDLQWKGSFLYDDKTNILTYDASWAAEVGPYPVLYDDGPISDGGHEMPGATAGDHIFSIEAYVQAKADVDQQYQYGAINEFGNWIWEGSNGQFTVPKGSTDRIDATGYFIHAFGTYDLILTLDTSKLNSGFLPFDPASDKIYVKGTMNSWDKHQLLDNGQKGDTAASDGIYTYHHAENLGPHDGLLYAGQHVQFVFMINAVEYKRGDALSDGVDAKTNCQGATSFQDVPVFLEPESRGKIKNTTVLICEGGGKLAVTSVVPASGTPAGGTEVSVYGSGFVDGAQVSFGGTAASNVQFVGAGQLNCTTPAHAGGKVVVRVDNPGGDHNELTDGFTFAEGNKPEILFLEPGMGPVGGGTQVVITGRQFDSGATVSFDQSPATGVTVKSAQEIDCTTPAHAEGRVVVTVTNPGGLASSFPDGFEYVAGSGPTIQRVDPAVGSTKGGDTVTVVGSGFAAGAQVWFDTAAATSVLVQGAASISCATPAHAEGSVPVKVQNPDQQQYVLQNGFSYQKPKVDWAILQSPLTLTLNSGVASALIYGRVYKAGVTDGPGQGFGIQAQVGYGPDQSDPTQDASGWNWWDAVYNATCTGCSNNDEYQGTITIPQSGQYAYAYRFSMDTGDTWVYADSNGTQDGYQPANAGKATVRGGTGLEVWEVQPPAGSVLGGTAITVKGNAFAAGAVVSLGGQDLTTTFVDAQTLQSATHAHALGAVDVKVTNPDSTSATDTGGFSFVLRGTPVIDGVIDTSGPDWNDAFLAGQNQTPSDWGANHIDKLYVAFDDQSLYLGILGYVEANNAIVAYLDTDFGPASGVRDMNTLTDATAGLDNAVSSKIVVTTTGFGAEYAAGTKGMASVANAMVQDAGLRLIVPPAAASDFYWKNATVKCGTGAVEMALPMSEFFPTGIPAGGARLAVFVRLVNADGQYLSNGTLPPDTPSAPEQVTQVFVFEVR